LPTSSGPAARKRIADEETLQFYRRNAEAYAGWAKAPSTRLTGFLALLPLGGSILELGCGASNHSAKMLEAGFQVRATDGSPEMAEVASVGILARIYGALKPAGVFYASFKIGDDDGRDSLGRYYNYPSSGWLEATYAAAGEWISLASDTGAIESFDETPATMLHLIVRKRAA
jgi:hypothetical protein